MAKISKEQIQEWRKPPEGFFAWLDFVKPHVLDRSNRLIPFEVQDFQQELFENALRCNDDGDYKYNTLIVSLPRRHSKTTCAGLLVLYRFCLFPNENIKVISNSERQALRVNFKMLKDLITNSKVLRDWVGLDNVQRMRIDLPDLHNRIEVVVGNIPSLYGERITCGWFSELHAAGDDQALQILSSSQGDVANAWTIVDSTTDPVNGPLHQLEQAQSKDPSIYVYRTEYANISDAKKNSPYWISRSWLDSRKAQLLDVEFASQHLNKRSEAANKLFPTDSLKTCKQGYKNKISRDEFESLVDGRKYVCGGGLDRAYMLSAHGDATIWTTVARTSNTDGEAQYYVLNQQKILAGLAKSIKKEILEDDAKYGLENIIFESYNSQDLSIWATEQGLSNEIVHVTGSLKLSAFQDLSNLVRENRLYFPDELQELEKEMRVFSFEYNKNGNIIFGTRKKKDDRIFSLLWAVYALRKSETVIYELGDIVCNSKSQHARLCLLRNGNMILNCSNTCAAYKQVQAMYNQYRKANPESELTIQDFFARLVKVKGIRTYKAV